MANNIYKKMLDATSEIEKVAKNLSIITGKDKNGKAISYKAVSELDIIEAVKPVEIKHGIFSYPFARKIVESDIISSETQYGTKKQFFLRVETTYRFVNVDEPTQYIEVVAYGDGIDSGDKATGKAITYADKYCLMKAYKISTGDDPDQEASTELKQVNATAKQVEMLKKYYTGENLKKLLEFNHIEKLEDMPKDKASEIISKIMESQK